MASLLEVGTGFHPEMTGRENIYMNGTIMGMRRKEIDQKLDEIIEFAGVAKYIDTPVKRYSSGMTVRLGFAVAAHLNSEILVVDEVLAVGDAEFQKKAIGKMQDISKGQGRTVLFVSHNLAAVRNLCNTGILLKQGELFYKGDTDSAIDTYINSTNDFSSDSLVEFSKKQDKLIYFSKVWLVNKNGEYNSEFDVLDEIIINFEFIAAAEVSDVEISVVITNSRDINVLFCSLSEINDNKFISFTKGGHHATLKIKAEFLIPDTYLIRLRAHKPNVESFDAQDKMYFIITETGSIMSKYGSNAKHLSCVMGGTKWELKQIND
jgi:lipopolysaccharide transport system ATP-binding protein